MDWEVSSDLEKGGGDEDGNLVPVYGPALVQLVSDVPHGAHVWSPPEDPHRFRSLLRQLPQHHLKRCNVSPSPTDVSPTENSWMLQPLDKVSLSYFAPDRTIPSL